MLDLFKNMDHINNIHQPQNIFYRAVVENNNDGGKGKVQVRILGVHSPENKRTGTNMGVPPEELPWAEVMGPTDVMGGVGTYGKTAIPLQGAWVWVFFDSGDWNKPIVCGIIYGAEASKPTGNKGFEDPDQKYPEEDKIEEGTTRTSANRKINETGIKKVRDQNIDEDIPTAKEGETNSEQKESTSSVSYPNNESQAWPDGSFVEYDCTSGGRYHHFHNSGTYTEILPSGMHSVKVVDSQKLIVDMDAERFIKQNETHTVQGNSLYKIDGDRTIVVGGDSKETVSGDVEEIYEAEHSLEVTGDVTHDYSANFDLTISGDETDDISGNYDGTIGGNYDETIGGKYDGTIGGNYDLMVGGKGNQTYGSGLSVNGGTSISMTAAMITLN